MGKFFGILAAGIALVLFIRNDNLSGETILAIVILLTVGALAGGCTRAADSADQSARDARAGTILAELRSGIERDVILYLRPFALDQSLIETDPEDMSVFRPGRYSKPLVHFERVLNDAIESMGPVISLGRRGAMVGAARLETEDQEWVNLFSSWPKRRVRY